MVQEAGSLDDDDFVGAEQANAQFARQRAQLKGTGGGGSPYDQVPGGLGLGDASSVGDFERAHDYSD